ncbi:MAG: hypothetical protein ABJQ90_09565 [Parasphingorhabdus sp.]
MTPIFERISQVNILSASGAKADNINLSMIDLLTNYNKHVGLK